MNRYTVDFCPDTWWFLTIHTKLSKLCRIHTSLAIYIHKIANMVHDISFASSTWFFGVIWLASSLVSLVVSQSPYYDRDTNPNLNNNNNNNNNLNPNPKSNHQSQLRTMSIPSLSIRFIHPHALSEKRLRKRDSSQKRKKKMEGKKLIDLSGWNEARLDLADARYTDSVIWFRGLGLVERQWLVTIMLVGMVRWMILGVRWTGRGELLMDEIMKA